MGMFPKLNGKSHLGVKIPSLSGGLNEFDAVNLVDDNQLTQCENMWFDGGMLKTRPGFTLKQEGMTKLVSQNYGDIKFVEYIRNNITIMRDGKKHKLMAAIFKCEFKNIIVFYLINGNGTITMLPQIAEEANVDIINCLLLEHKNKIYAYIKKRAFSGGIDSEEFPEPTLPEYKVFFYDFVKEEWQDVEAENSDEHFEVPLTMTNCRPIEGLEISGDIVRGYNLLNGGEKIEMFAFPKTAAGDSVFGIEFSLKFKLKINTKIKMTIKRTDGNNLEFECVWNGDYVYSNTEFNNTFLRVENWEDEETFFRVWCEHNKNEEPWTDTFYPDMINEELSLYQTDQPNVTLTYYREVTEEEKDRIFMATRCEWFGTEGLNDGSRLFVGGNKNEALKNLLHFSDSGNPLYFPENCYMRVGDNSQSITALAKQSNMLVIFSERQLHFLTYQSGVNVTPEDITENGQYDLTVLNATFPLTQIHNQIGCDLPSTVQLCRNRLVWATKEGKVYVLMDANQYSERNVYELSQNVEKSLKKALLEYTADFYWIAPEVSAVDWQSKYVLKIGNKFFVMNYDGNSFSYISSYSDSNKAQKNIVWHVWNFPVKFEALYSDGESIMGINRPRRWGQLFLCDGTAEKDIFCTNLNDDGWKISDWDFVPEFEERDIEAMLQTKVFDFNNPGTKKSVDQVYIGFGGNGEKEINVTFVSEKGEQYRSFFPHCADTTPFSAGYVSVERFLPCLAHITRLGIKIESKGNLAINSITINYRLLGGVR